MPGASHLKKLLKEDHTLVQLLLNQSWGTTSLLGIFSSSY